MSERIWTAALIVIGDEVLSGRTQDANVAYLGGWLNVQGIRLREVRVVADDMGAIGAAVTALAPAHDYLFTTGGIGPTHDDITVEAIAAALGLPVVVDDRARAILADYYATRGGLNEGRLRMARVPQGASLIVNAATGAPGIRIRNIHILAGVPHIARQMLDSLVGTLDGGAPLVSGTVGAWIGESEVAGLLRGVEKAHGGCQVGSYPFFREGRTGANFVVRATDATLVDTALAAIAAGLVEKGAEPVAGGI